MHYRIPIGAVMLAVALGVAMGDSRAFDEAKYPNWKGQWLRSDTGTPRYDPSKPSGRGQQAPLIPEYQAILEASLADQAAGGQGGDPTYTCLAPGMPRIMNNYEGAEFVITPNDTHILMEHIYDFRRIYTDGRAWPQDIYPSFAGYSIGKWIDEAGSGRYNMLEVETRGFKGPRTYDNSGLPLHVGQSECHHGADFPGQGRSGYPLRRDNDGRPCLDASLDGDEEIPPRAKSTAGLA